MHKKTVTRGVVAVALLAALSTGMTACTPTTSADPRPTPTDASPSSSPTPEHTPATTDFGTEPSAGDAPACDALLPDDLVRALVPDAEPVDAITELAHPAATWNATRLTGGTGCWASNGSSPLDDRAARTADEPAYEGVRVAVLPDAAAAFRTAGTDATAPAESATTVRCAASDAARVYCNGGVLAGTAWVDVAVVRLQTASDATPEAMQPEYEALLEHVRETVAASPAASVDGDDSDDWSFTDCTTDGVAAVADTTLRDSVTLTDTPPTIDEFAQSRVGGSTCRFVGPEYATGAVYASVPDSGWVVEQRLAAGTVDRDGRIDLPGLGARDAAWRTCDELACTVDVVHDRTWTQYLLTTEAASDTAAAVERWAASSFGS
ncbi:hypothetical protein [Curtobacterium sp. MCBD17_008]|uniref:hypothetical protein n=1 Tax=Curtobacterium sp. MCBD17_008 TaxID=2175656 RepID=UPI0011B6ECAF|nr:hypothetical protein [Curtobacterium sp. MCBD17_008]